MLLKNQGLLPLTGTGKILALIGRPAGPTGTRDYFMGAGSSSMSPNGRDVVSPLTGITDRAKKNGDTVTYADGTAIADAVATAKVASVAIVFAGDIQAEGIDRPSLAMANCVQGGICTTAGPSQDQLIDAVASVNPNTIVVLQDGNPISMPWLPKVKSVLEMWYPGQVDGTAAARLLFGDANPSGKLPITFPKSLADSPLRTAAQYPGVNDSSGVPHSKYSEGLLVGYRWYDAKHISPLFPFGFGLSYTTFRYSDIRVDGTSVTFTVANTGHRQGAEVAQLYLSFPAAAHEPPKQLKGYRKVVLKPGQSQRVTIGLDKRAFQYWDHGWRTAPGCYTVRVGGSSSVLPLTGEIAQGGSLCAGMSAAPRPRLQDSSGGRLAAPRAGRLASTGLPIRLVVVAIPLAVAGLMRRRVIARVAEGSPYEVMSHGTGMRRQQQVVRPHW